MKKRYLIVILYIAFLLLPIYWLVAMSFKTTGEILAGFSLFPQHSRVIGFWATSSCSSGC